MRELEAKGILVVPQAWYERPLFYHPNRLNVIGTDEDVRWPAYSQLMDFELEFGCYIGKPGHDIPKEKAREHIFGYTIFNDFSARDEQVKEMPGQLGPGKGKDFDGSNAMGPCLVTADEIDPYNLTMVAVSTAKSGVAATPAKWAGSSRTASPMSRAAKRSSQATSSAPARSATAAASSRCASSSPATSSSLRSRASASCAIASCGTSR